MSGAPVSSSTRVLNMRGINLDEVKYMSAVLKQSVFSDSEIINSERNPRISEILIYIFIFLFLLCILSFLLYIFRYKILHINCSRNHRKVIKNEQPDNFALGEGGVMHSPKPSVLG